MSDAGTAFSQPKGEPYEKKRGSSDLGHYGCLVIGAISLALLGDAFAAKASKRINEVFGSNTNLTRAIIDIEAALARAEAKLGVIPKAASDEINRRADIKYVPADEVAKEQRKVWYRTARFRIEEVLG